MASRQRTRSVPALALIFALALAIYSPASGQPAEQPGWLFIVEGQVVAAEGGRLAIDAGASALAFTDRPSRLVQFIDLAAFIADAWGPAGDFRRDPPNASLVDETRGTIGVIEITDAGWEDGITTINFVILEGTLPTAGDRVALTIDVMHPTQY